MSKDDRSVLSWAAFAVAIAALFLTLFALNDDGGTSAAGAEGGSQGQTATVVTVELSEFAISPATINLPTGDSTIKIINNGSVAHNLSFPSLSLTSPDVNPGETYEWKLSSLPEGDLEVICLIAGHADSGMRAMAMVGGAGGDAVAAPATTMSVEEMETIMRDNSLSFPAETEGHGGELLEPTVLADGTKVYDLVSEIVKWEVEPGKFIDAWTYNGVVPAPEIRVQVGDIVRINLTNKLPEPTVIHWHGIRVPNEFDGVDPFTQEAVQIGETFTYEFEALEPAVGIYHSHHNGHRQVPNGLFGAFIIGDLEIPDYLADKGFDKIDKRVNMILNDAGTIGLSLNGKSFPATEAYTLKVGETMLVNYMNEGLQIHPMHLHQPTGWIIAKDGVPLEFPMPSDTVSIAPGERYSVLYKAVDPGVWAWHCHILTHAERDTGMFGMVTALIVTE